MGFEIGKTVAGYEIVEVLGTSKTGVAYKVRNVFAQRFEVMKILPKSIQDDEEQNARFLREIKVHAQLLHPNIVTFYNAREIEGQLVMTTEFVPGVILMEKLQAGPIAWREASRYACHALSALEYAHGHGIIHRGFSSSNLIITGEGIARLTGFGFAKSVSDPELTAAGVVLGALKYMSPEQVKGEAIDVRCDVYSLGIVFYEMLAGRVPFDAKGQFEIMMAQVNTPPKHLSDVNPAVPRELGDLVDRALAKSPDNRFQTARDFRKAIELISLARETAAPESNASSRTDAEVPQPIAVPLPAAETTTPVIPASLPDAWAIESALELAESKLATMELKSTQPAVDSSAFVGTPAVPPSPDWGFDVKHDSAPKAPAFESSQLTEALVTVPQPAVDWWTSDVGVTAESKPVTAVLEAAPPVVEAAHIEAPAEVVSVTLPDTLAIESAIVSAESKPDILKAELELPPPIALFERTVEPAPSVLETEPVHQTPANAASTSLPDAQAIEAALFSAESKRNALESELELPAIQAFELPADTTQPVVEPTPIQEAAATTIDSVLAPTDPKPNTQESALELPPAAVFEQPVEAAEPTIDGTTLSEAPTIISSANSPEAQSIEPAIASVESTPARTELILEPESSIVSESPETPVLDWWARNSQLPATESGSSEAEFSLSPPEPEPMETVVATPMNTEPPATDKPSSPPDFWSSDWPAPVESKPESAQLELLSAAVEPSTPAVDSRGFADGQEPEPTAPVLQSGFWAAETLQSPLESRPAAEDLSYSTALGSKGFFDKHEEPVEEPLSLWTSGPPDTWVSEPAAPPPAEKSEPADLQSLSATLDPPEAPIESIPQVEAPAATLAQDPPPIELQPQATEEPPPLAPEIPQAVAATANVPAPVAQTPAQVNPDLLTALFGDTLLSRVSLTLVVCAITFFLGTVTLFAVLSVTKP